MNQFEEIIAFIITVTFGGIFGLYIGFYFPDTEYGIFSFFISEVIFLVIFYRFLKNKKRKLESFENKENILIDQKQVLQPETTVSYSKILKGFSWGIISFFCFLIIWLIREAVVTRMGEAKTPEGFNVPFFVIVFLSFFIFLYELLKENKKN